MRYLPDVRNMIRRLKLIYYHWKLSRALLRTADAIYTWLDSLEKRK